MSEIRDARETMQPVTEAEQLLLEGLVETIIDARVVVPDLRLGTEKVLVGLRGMIHELIQKHEREFHFADLHWRALAKPDDGYVITAAYLESSGQQIELNAAEIVRLRTVVAEQNREILNLLAELRAHGLGPHSSGIAHDD